jgi:hypothetical protein
MLISRLDTQAEAAKGAAIMQKGRLAMHASKTELPLLLEAGPASIRGADWDDLRVGVISVPAGTDFGPLLKGLPGDRCQGPHWGYMLKGRLRVQYENAEELLTEGDFFYMPAGHTAVAEEETEFIEVNPPGPHQQVIDNAQRNLEAMR